MSVVEKLYTLTYLNDKENEEVIEIYAYSEEQAIYKASIDGVDETKIIEKYCCNTKKFATY